MLELKQKITQEEALKKLKENGRCAILRPTGFGKTVIMCRIAKMYDRVLYVYPTEIIRQTAKKHLAGKEVDWMTYTRLGKYHTNPEDIAVYLSDNYDLVVFDEIHHMGAKNTRASIERILEVFEELNSNTKIVGGTATPKRMDGYDVIDNFFNNSLVSFYGINNAIEDGVIPKPYYVYALDGYEVFIKQIRKVEQRAKVDKKDVKVDLRTIEGQIANILNAPSIIKDTVNTVFTNTPPAYMRFMVFLSTKSMIQAKLAEVEHWFIQAFPDYTIRTTVVHSGKEFADNVYTLDKLGKPNKTVDLVVSINMLNEGYHLSDITGVVMLRPTVSNTVYTQQIGRCLQVYMKHNPIIFDFVQNIEVQSIFDLDVSTPTRKHTDEDSLSFEEQLDRLGAIDPKNLYITNKIAEASKVMRKIDNLQSTKVERAIIRDRKTYKAPAEYLAKKYKLQMWEVILILLKYDDELKATGLSVSEADNRKSKDHTGKTELNGFIDQLNKAKKKSKTTKPESK